MQRAYFQVTLKCRIGEKLNEEGKRLTSDAGMTLCSTDVLKMSRRVAPPRPCPHSDARTNGSDAHVCPRTMRLDWKEQSSWRRRKGEEEEEDGKEGGAVGREGEDQHEKE